MDTSLVERNTRTSHPPEPVVRVQPPEGTTAHMPQGSKRASARGRIHVLEASALLTAVHCR